MPRNRPIRLAIVLCTLLSSAAEAATVLHSEPLRGYRVGAALRDATAKPTGTGPTTVTFNAFSRDFALELEPNGRLAAVQARLERDSAAAAYRGKIAGRADSWVRLVLTPAGPAGLVFDGETLYGVETANVGDGAARAAPAMYRLADVYFAPGELGCEIGAAPTDGMQALALMAEEFTALEAAGATLNLDLGAVADFEFSQRFGAATQAELLTRFNNVDGIFSEQLGVQITVAEIDIFTANDDPFTTSAASALLDQLANYRGATAHQDAQGLTHLFTGRDLDGSTVGVAFLGAVCARRTVFDTRSFGAGLTQGGPLAAIDSLIAAHEIGHNFGAPHDGDANGACASTPTTFLMAPSFNGSSQFSSCSVAQMEPEIAGASCLTPIGAPNMAVTLPQPGNVLAGVAFDHTVTVVNEGAEAATGVVLSASTAPGLTIVAADAGASTCSVAAAAASCPLGTVSGGAARTVTLTLRAPDPGTFALSAAVAAAIDADSGDDRATVAVTAVPFVDLVWSGSASGVQLDTQTTITAVLANTADLAASGVAVTASSTAGLRPDQASLGGAACTVTGPAIACPVRALAAQTNVTLVVTATALTAGTQQLSLSATSGETERTPGDNRLAIAVNVTAPQDDGGGGALPWWVVLALLAARGLRGRALPERRRHS